MKRVDCKKYAQEILDSVKALENKRALAIVTVGNDPASASYVRGKIKDCEYCGIPHKHVVFGEDVHTATLINAIRMLNLAENMGGIIVQQPMPERLKDWSVAFTNAVGSMYDVDGFKSDSPFAPCTPEGIIYLLKQELGDLTGMNALIIGRGELVGKPLIGMLLDENCTVTIAHSKTRNLDDLLQRHDIIIVATGRPGLIDLKKCKAKMVVDVGVNRGSDGKLCGDCYNFDPDDGSDMLVTPVPGGVGLMTRAILMKHVGENSK